MRRDARTFQVSGMHCAVGMGKVEAALGELPGVMRVAASLEPGLARVEFHGDRVGSEAIASTLDSLGYRIEDRAGGEAALDRERAFRRTELRRQTRWTNRNAMELTPAMWLGMLPFVLLLLNPWFGFKAMLAVALAWAIVTALACWIVCATRSVWLHSQGGT